MPTTTTTKPPARKQTIKQAKASFTSRGRPTISLVEQRQLERAAELEQRAWRSKDQAKRNADAAKRRLEKERARREEVVRNGLGTQMRRDRFGMKSSQFHLGAFFGKGGMKREEKVVEEEEEEEEEEEFGEAGVDDEVLLGVLEDEMMADACQLRDRTAMRQQGAMSDSVVPVDTPPRTSRPLKRSMTEPSRSVFHDDDLAAFLGELDSSTQIARELVSVPRSPSEEDKKTVDEGRTNSFDAGDFDLTVEDMEGMDLELGNGQAAVPCPPKVAETINRRDMPPPVIRTRATHHMLDIAPTKPKAVMMVQSSKDTPLPPCPCTDSSTSQFTKSANDRSLMPPPPLNLPFKRHIVPKHASVAKISIKAVDGRKSMPPPPVPIKAQRSTVNLPPQQRLSYAGFTMTELEGFVDDDLQLTQVGYG